MTITAIIRTIPAIIQSMYTLLRRIDPAAHIDRWYMVTVQPSLLDDIAIICAYGNRRNEWQQLYVVPATSQAEAITQAQAIVDRKLRRGYQQITE